MIIFLLKLVSPETVWDDFSSEERNEDKTKELFKLNAHDLKVSHYIRDYIILIITTRCINCYIRNILFCHSDVAIQSG